ncbi:MAG: NHL repeat-containing protein [Chloroflexia bacterium]
MPSDATTSVTWKDPHGSEPEQWRLDLLFPTLFLCAATLLLAAIDPIHVGLQSYLIPTILAAVTGSLVADMGALRHDVPLLVAGSVFLIGLLALCLGTQPVALGSALSAVWPLRLGLLGLVVVAWAVLMSPPLWLRRAINALVVPGVLGLLIVGGPSLAFQLFGWGTPPTQKFPPLWLATASDGTLYATNIAGNYLWVFSPSGVPIGTLWPGAAPPVGTPGPGLVTLADPDPSSRAITSSLRLMEPLTSTLPADQMLSFTLCGVAVDAFDRVYTADSLNQQLLQFDVKGIITARWTLPRTFGGSAGCLAADDKHVYVASRSRNLYFLDFQGKVLKDLSFDYDIESIADDGAGALYVLGAGRLDKIDVQTGGVEALVLPPREGEQFAAYQTLVVKPGGEIVVTDRSNAQLLRIAPGGGRTIEAIGERGTLPGQFLTPGGLALDAKGNIYVADWALGVIQRFSPSGDFDTAWTAPGEKLVPSLEEEEGE